MVGSSLGLILLRACHLLVLVPYYISCLVPLLFECGVWSVCVLWGWLAFFFVENMNEPQKLHKVSYFIRCGWFRRLQ